MKYKNVISSLLAVILITATAASGVIVSDTAEADGNSLARRLPLLPLSQDHMCSVIPRLDFECEPELFDDPGEETSSVETDSPPPVIQTETGPSDEENGDATSGPEPTLEVRPRPSDAFPEYVTAVPESDAVDDSYFSDALFIGDSRTVSLMLYSGVKSYYYALQGLSISGVMNKAFIEDTENGETVIRTVIDTIERYPNAYKKVYLCLGCNELGWNYSSTFISVYEQVVNKIMALLPDAVIYIQAIIPVSAEVAELNNFGINNSRIYEYNTLLSQLALKCGINFLAVDEHFADESYTLPEVCSFDGIHLNVDSAREHMNYLRTHTAVPQNGGTTDK